MTLIKPGTEDDSEWFRATAEKLNMGWKQWDCLLLINGREVDDWFYRYTEGDLYKIGEPKIWALRLPLNRGWACMFSGPGQANTDAVYGGTVGEAAAKLIRRAMVARDISNWTGLLTLRRKREIV